MGALGKLRGFKGFMARKEEVAFLEGALYGFSKDLGFKVAVPEARGLGSCGVGMGSHWVRAEIGVRCCDSSGV